MVKTDVVEASDKLNSKKLQIGEGEFFELYGSGEKATNYLGKIRPICERQIYFENFQIWTYNQILRNL
jgi:hypothetical protein